MNVIRFLLTLEQLTRPRGPKCADQSSVPVTTTGAGTEPTSKPVDHYPELPGAWGGDCEYCDTGAPHPGGPVSSAASAPIPRSAVADDNSVGATTPPVAPTESQQRFCGNCLHGDYHHEPWMGDTSCDLDGCGCPRFEQIHATLIFPPDQAKARVRDVLRQHFNARTLGGPGVEAALITEASEALFTALFAPQ